MLNILYWSDYRPLYFLVSYGGALVLFLMAAWPVKHSQTKDLPKASWLFLFFLCFWMVASRWPGLFYFLPFDPDEAQIVAAAQTLGTQPVLYRMADGASAGPLVIYGAGLPWIFGSVPSLVVARLIAVLYAWAGVAAIYIGIRATGAELAGRLGALAAALFYGLNGFWNFVHYNSEMLPSALCAWSTAFLVSLFCMNRVNGSRRWEWRAYLAAMLLSMVPFAKLQLVPLALCIGILIYGRGVWMHSGKWTQTLRYTGMLALSILIFPAAFFLFIYFGGGFDYFFHSYILNNLLYAGSGYSSRFNVAWQLLKTGDEMILWGGGGVIATSMILLFDLLVGAGKSGPRRIIALICISLAGVAAYCVLAPSRDYIHYLLLLPLPMAFALGAVVAWMEESEVKALRHRAVLLIAPAVLILALLPYLFVKVKSNNSWAGSAYFWSHKPWTGVAAELLKRSKSPSEGLLVWGYVPELNVNTGILQASRLSITSAQIQQNALTPFYRKSLMEDLSAHPPRFIVDAVCKEGFIFTDGDLYGPKCFPEFNRVLTTDYQLVGDFTGMRLYERIIR